MAVPELSYTQTVADLSALLQDNYKGRVKPWLDVIIPVAALFQRLGPGEYSLEGKKLIFAGDSRYAGMAMATDGHLPGSQYAEAVQLNTTPARTYVRRMVDNFTVAAGAGEAAFENFMDRIMRQMWESFERMTARHIHGSSAATVCRVKTRTSATVVVVHQANGYTATAGWDPSLYTEEGMWLASLDSSAGFAVLAVARLLTIVRSSIVPEATFTFATTIEGAGTIAVDDLLVFATSTVTTDNWFVTERNRAPLGLLDIVDPLNTLSSYLGVTETDHPRINPIRAVSADWGEVEFMEYVTEILSRSNAPVTPDTHTFTLHPGVKIELAKTLTPFTRIEGKGKELDGGWTAVRIAGHDFVEDPYHIPDVCYGLCTEDLFVVDLDGDPRIWEGDGSQFRRIANYDGKEWFARHYLQRFACRRNRLGALTAIPNPKGQRFVPVPV